MLHCEFAGLIQLPCWIGRESAHRCSCEWRSRVASSTTSHSLAKEFPLSHCFCFGLTQFGPLLSLCRSGRKFQHSRVATVDVMQTQRRYVSAFLQVIAEVGDEHHFPTFAGKYVMSFPQHPFVSHSPPRQPKLPPPYLMQLEIPETSLPQLLIHVELTGRGTK